MVVWQEIHPASNPALPPERDGGIRIRRRKRGKEALDMETRNTTLCHLEREGKYLMLQRC